MHDVVVVHNASAVAPRPSGIMQYLLQGLILSLRLMLLVRCRANATFGCGSYPGCSWCSLSHGLGAGGIAYPTVAHWASVPKKPPHICSTDKAQVNTHAFW